MQTFSTSRRRRVRKYRVTCDTVTIINYYSQYNSILLFINNDNGMRRFTFFGDESNEYNRSFSIVIFRIRTIHVREMSDS